MFHCKLFKLPPSPCSSPRNVNLIGTNKETDRKVLLLMTFVFALFTQNLKPLNARWLYKNPVTDITAACSTVEFTAATPPKIVRCLNEFGFKLSCWNSLLRSVRDIVDKCKTHFLEIKKYSQSNAGVGTNLSMKIATFVMRSAKNMTPIAEWGLPRKSMCENVRALVKFLEKETFLKTSISTCQIFLAVIFRKKSWTERAFLSLVIHEYKAKTLKYRMYLPHCG